MVEWLKSKWKWLATGAAVGLVMLVALLTRQSVSARDVKAALALRDIQRANELAKAAEAKAAELATAYLAEEVALEAAKERNNALSDADRIAELRRRGLLK
jgi:predicted negative regulator of RcsB-dependent stress response